MKIYNQDGKLIHKLPSYQQGGFILPTYTPPQVSLQRPGNSQQLFAATDKTTSDGWSRYVQGTQLNLQAAQTTQSMLHANVDLKLRMQNQERVNKQLELQNKKFEFELLKTGANEIQEIMKMDDDFVLDRDRPIIDNILKQNQADDESVANLDPRDVESIFRKGALKTSLMYAQKNLMTNKKKFNDISTQLATSEDLLKRADTLSKLGYLDNKALNDTLDAFNNVRKKQLEFANGTLPDIDLATDPDYLKISQFQDIIDEKQQKAMQDLQMKEQESEIRSRQSIAALNEQKTIHDQQTLPLTLEQEKLKLELDTKKGELYNKAYSDFIKTNPTLDQINEFEQKMAGKFKTAEQHVPTSPDQLWTYGVLTGNDDYVQKAEEYKQLNNNKTTDVNYNYPIKDGSGREFVQNTKTSERIYAGWVTDDAGVFKKGTYGGTDLTSKQILDAGGAINDDGSIDIKQSKLVELIPGILKGQSSYNSNNITSYFSANNAVLIDDAWGTDNNLWKIKPSGTLPVNSEANSGGFMGGTQSTVTPAISPDNPFGK